MQDYWNLDDMSIVMVADKGAKGTSNMLNFNVGEGVKLNLPNQFWTRLQNTFGTTFFVRDNGEDIAILCAAPLDHPLHGGRRLPHDARMSPSASSRPIAQASHRYHRLLPAG